MKQPLDTPPKYPYPSYRIKGDDVSDLKEGDIVFFPYDAREGFYLVQDFSKDGTLTYYRNSCGEGVERRKRVVLICGNISNPDTAKKWEWWEDIEYGWCGEGWSDWWNWGVPVPDLMDADLYHRYYS